MGLTYFKKKKKKLKKGFFSKARGDGGGPSVMDCLLHNEPASCGQWQGMGYKVHIVACCLWVTLLSLLVIDLCMHYIAIKCWLLIV